MKGSAGSSTVTTKHDGEVRRILGEAMRTLGIAQDTSRLPCAQPPPACLRKAGPPAAAGYFAVRRGGQPGRAHGASGRARATRRPDRGSGRCSPGNLRRPCPRRLEPARRCDMLLVRVTQRSLRIECVEVKGRRAAQFPDALADDIVDQLEHTERVLLRQFFASEPPRIDGPSSAPAWPACCTTTRNGRRGAVSSTLSASPNCIATSTGLRSRRSRPRSTKPATSLAWRGPQDSSPSTATSPSRCSPPTISEGGLHHVGSCEPTEPPNDTVPRPDTVYLQRLVSGPEPTEPIRHRPVTQVNRAWSAQVWKPPVRIPERRPARDANVFHIEAIRRGPGQLGR